MVIRLVGFGTILRSFDLAFLNIFHNLQVGLGEMGNNFEKFLDTGVNGYGNSLVTKLLNFGIADFVITLIGVSTLTLSNFAAFNVFLDKFCDLKI